MATYTSGIDEDHVIKTISSDNDIDLTAFINKFKKLKEDLQNTPKIKTAPDEETLEYWNEFFVHQDAQQIKAFIDSRVKALYGDLKPIKDAGLLPSKYDDEYQQLKNYINSL